MNPLSEVYRILAAHGRAVRLAQESEEAENFGELAASSDSTPSRNDGTPSLSHDDAHMTSGG